MENKIKSVLDALVDSGYDVDEDEVAKLLSTPNIKWDNPENVYFLHCFPNEQTLDGVLKKLYPNADHIKLTFLYQNYGYLEHQIQSVLKPFSYQGGIADKSRWVLKQYFNYLVGETVGDITERKWYQPDLGDTVLWIQFVELCINVYYSGFTKNNIAEMQKYFKMAEECSNGRH